MRAALLLLLLLPAATRGTAGDMPPPCPVPTQGLASPGWASCGAQLLTRNLAPWPVDVFWVTPDGSETHGITLAARGGQQVFFTCAQHVWRLRAASDGRLVGETTVGDAAWLLQAVDCAGLPRKPPFRVTAEFNGGSLDVHAGGALDRSTAVLDERIPVRVSLLQALEPFEANVGWNQTVVCPQCAGLGGPHAHVCPRCNGTGVRAAVDAGSGLQHEAPCALCAGHGVVSDELCPVCGGDRTVQRERSGVVPVPAGIRSGHQITLGGLGDVRLPAGPALLSLVESGEAPRHEHASVVLAFDVEAQHDNFTRSGDDLFMPLPISLSDALFGFNRTVQAISGHNIHLERSGLTSPGLEIEVPGMGMPLLDGPPGARGMLVLEVDVDMSSADAMFGLVGDPGVGSGAGDGSGGESEVEELDLL